MLPKNHRVDESNFNGQAPLQTGLPTHPVWGRPYTLTTTRQNIQPVVENHDGPVNHPNQPTASTIQKNGLSFLWVEAAPTLSGSTLNTLEISNRTTRRLKEK